MSHELRVLSRVLRAAVEALEAELGEDAPVQAERRKGVRPVYRPQGPVDEVNARRADEALKRAGLVPVAPRRK